MKTKDFRSKGVGVNSHELRAGDLVVGQDQDRIRITSVRQEWADELPVSNLTIEEDHNYFVGEFSVLVHNTAICDKTVRDFRVLHERGMTVDYIRMTFYKAGHRAEDVEDAIQRILAPRRGVLTRGEDFEHLKSFVFKDSKGKSWDLFVDGEVVDGKLIIREAHIGPSNVPVGGLDDAVGQLEIKNLAHNLAEQYGVKRIDIPQKLHRGGTQARRNMQGLSRTKPFEFGEVYITIDETGRVRIRRLK